MGQGIVRKQGTTNANECTMCGMGEYHLHRIQNAAEYSCIYVQEILLWQIKYNFFVKVSPVRILHFLPSFSPVRILDTGECPHQYRTQHTVYTTTRARLQKHPTCQPEQSMVAQAMLLSHQPLTQLPCFGIQLAFMI